MSDWSLSPASELRRPTQIGSQLSLFPAGRDELLAKARVSLDDADRWRRLGWLSFDPAPLSTLEDAQAAELVFVRDLARAGLPNDLVTEMLGELERPYAYPPATTAYNFSYGWVEVVFPDMDEIVERHLGEWAREKTALGDEERLAAASDHLMLALAELRAGRKARR